MRIVVGGLYGVKNHNDTAVKPGSGVICDPSKEVDLPYDVELDAEHRLRAEEGPVSTVLNFVSRDSDDAP